jgi:hypothetical protein
MDADTVQGGVPKLANGDHVAGLMDNQEREQQKAEKRARRASELAQARLAIILGRAPAVRPSTEVPEDTVNIWDRWLQGVSDDCFRDATTCKRKIIKEVGDKYLGDQQFRVRLPGREHADGKAVLAIVIGNTAGCSSEASIGEWLKMPKTAVHTLVNKEFHAVTTCLSAMLIPTSIFANRHIGGRPPPSLQAAVGCVRLVVIAVDPSDVDGTPD